MDVDVGEVGLLITSTSLSFVVKVVFYRWEIIYFARPIYIFASCHLCESLGSVVKDSF